MIFYLIFVLIHAANGIICNTPGECSHSLYIGSVPASNSQECVRICQSYEYCNFATFNPNLNGCLMFENCETLETAFCSNCVTNSRECLNCDVSGRCLVNSIELIKWKIIQVQWVLHG